MPITYTSGEQVEVYRFSPLATIAIPLTVLVIQAFLPLWLPFFTMFDLPLLVVIFFAMVRRSPVRGLLTGSAIGLLQDSLTHHPIGMYGIAKTFVGWGASSLGAKLDLDNPGTRLLVTVAFYVVHEIIYFLVTRGMIGLTEHWSWRQELWSGLANASLGLFLYAVLDRFKQRA